jgi:hypothetical protein
MSESTNAKIAKLENANRLLNSLCNSYEKEQEAQDQTNKTKDLTIEALRTELVAVKVVNQGLQQVINEMYGTGRGGTVAPDHSPQVAGNARIDETERNHD